MTNPTKATWEQALLNKMTNNGERLAVVENKLTSVENRLTTIEQDLAQVKETTQTIESAIVWLKWIGGGVVAILLSVIANFVYSVIS